MRLAVLLSTILVTMMFAFVDSADAYVVRRGVAVGPYRAGGRTTACGPHGCVGRSVIAGPRGVAVRRGVVRY
jgi:hypothetical protein